MSYYIHDFTYLLRLLHQSQRLHHRHQNQCLILESTGLQPLLEEMAHKQMETKEEEYAEQIVNQDGATLQDLLNFKPEDGEIDTEDDESATQLEFAESSESSTNEEE